MVTPGKKLKAGWYCQGTLALAFICKVLTSYNENVLCIIHVKLITKYYSGICSWSRARRHQWIEIEEESARHRKEKDGDHGMGLQGNTRKNSGEKTEQASQWFIQCRDAREHLVKERGHCLWKVRWELTFPGTNCAYSIPKTTVNQPSHSVNY